MLLILIVVIVSWVYIYVSTYQTEHFICSLLEVSYTSIQLL